MMRTMLSGRLATLALLLLGLLFTLPAPAQEDDGLLPVTEAYRLSADASTPGVLKLHWEIAPDYYLYRGRMTFKPADGVTLGEASFPDGEKHHRAYERDDEAVQVETAHAALAEEGHRVAADDSAYEAHHDIEHRALFGVRLHD